MINLFAGIILILISSILVLLCWRFFKFTIVRNGKRIRGIKKYGRDSYASESHETLHFFKNKRKKYYSWLALSLVVAIGLCCLGISFLKTWNAG